MSEWKVHLEFEEDSSSKFWRARVDGKTLFVNYGKIGTAGQTQMKELANPDAAQKELEKLEREKRKKGYQDAGAGKASGGDDGDDDDADSEDEETPKRKPAGKAAAASKAPVETGRSIQMILAAKDRTIETRVVLAGMNVRVEADERYASPVHAREAYDRLVQALSDDGYKEK